MGLELVINTATKTAAVSQAAQSLCSRVGAVWVPTDNTIVAALSTVSQEALQANIPLVVADTTSIKEGSLVGFGFNYYKQGRMTGKQILEIMEGKKVREIPIIKMKKDKLELTLNLDIADKMNYKFPSKVVTRADSLIYQNKYWGKR